MTEFGPTGSDPSGIVTGPDQALWFTEQLSSSVGRITTSGSFTNSFATPTGGSEPSGIAAGPDTAVWFTEKVGKQDRPDRRLDPWRRRWRVHSAAATSAAGR